MANLVSDTLLTTALAGLAYGMGDFWPSDLKFEVAPAILTQADLLARGGRIPKNAQSAEHLKSIFCGLNPPASPQYYVPLAPLEMTPAALMPTPTPPTGNISSLRAAFQAAVRACWAQPAAIRLELILDATMRFGWCVPAAGFGVNTDVSRFSHARSVAAIAAAIVADGHSDTPDQAQFALVGGGLSGIQAFLYTLASNNAAKSLRARSFYLQLLTEAMSRWVLGELGLPITSLFYVGGGNFQLIAHAKAFAELHQLEAEIQTRLFKAHRAALSVLLRGVTFKPQGFATLSQQRSLLDMEFSRGKRRPFAAVPATELLHLIGAAEGVGGDPKLFCAVTGDDVTKRPDDPEADAKSDFVVNLEDLGGRLRRATYLTFKTVPASDPERDVKHWGTALRMFGLSVWVHTRDDAPNEHNALTLRLTPKPADPDLPSAYYPLAKFPLYAAEPLLYDDLAADSIGIARWAVLRMDIDGLGNAFKTGLGDNVSLSRLGSLSFALRLFFEGWLPYLAASVPNLDQRLTIQYAGGDDLFVVGSWDVICDFAVQVRESFRDYTAQTPALGLSGGIALADAHFPLYQAARMAGEAEDAAKTFIHADGRKKDAIDFLGETMSWAEYSRIRALVTNLKQWCGDDKLLPRSLLQTLQQLDAQASAEHEQNRRNGVINKRRFTRATWLAAYQMTRIIDSFREKEKREPAKYEQIKPTLQQIQNTLVAANANTRAIALAARWAEFLLREKVT